MQWKIRLTCVHTKRVKWYNDGQVFTDRDEADRIRDGLAQYGGWNAIEVVGPDQW